MMMVVVNDGLNAIFGRVKPELRAVEDKNDCLDIYDEWIPHVALFS